MFNAGTHAASLFSRVWVNHLIPHSGQKKKEMERTIACAKKKSAVSSDCGRDDWCPMWVRRSPRAKYIVVPGAGVVTSGMT